MDKRQIEMILTIRDIGNITKAADFIGITQPTLSKFLANTETKFGITIFYRYARSVKPTEEGIIFLETIENLLKTYRDYEQKTLAFKEGGAQELRLGIHPVLGKFIIPEIEDRAQRNKNIVLSYDFLNSRKVTEEVISGNLDLGVVADPQKYPDLIIRPLWKELIGLYSRDGKRKDIVFFNSNMIFANRFLNKFNFKIKRKVDDYSILYSILRSTDSMGLLPNPIAEAENELKLIESFQPNINVCLIFLSSKLKTQGMKEATSIVRDCAKKLKLKSKLHSQ